MKKFLLFILINLFHFSYDIKAQSASRLLDSRIVQDNTRRSVIKNIKLSNEIRLNENQKERLRSVNGIFDVLISGLRKDVKRMRLEIELEKLNDDIDDNKIYGLYDKIAETQAAIWKETFKKEQEIKFILNERQLLMHEKIRMRNQRDNARLKSNNKRE
tara:strand:+ start:5300 stop:5776 length:477 start_codon:yes stop_codon:yes gene_type:complete